MAATTATAASLPYHEPGIEDILILSSFLLVLNIVNSVLDRTLYCGLVGQVLVGIAWGTPGGKLLSSSLEDAIVQLGYLGLIMIVYEGMFSSPLFLLLFPPLPSPPLTHHPRVSPLYLTTKLTHPPGGLTTSLATLRSHLLLSLGIAITGIAFPIALSFLFLGPTAGASPLQSFAAGAALASTSLGTTFSVLRASGLAGSRLGGVLAAAALLDDVAGLVMVRVVAGLGGGGSGSNGEATSSGGALVVAPATVLRPVLVSLALAALVALACRLLVARGRRALRVRCPSVDAAAAPARCLVQTALLVALVAGASYAGASVLLAAYLAGVAGAWWDEQDALEPMAREDGVPASSPRGEEHTSPHVAAEPSASDTLATEGSCPAAGAQVSRPSSRQEVISCVGVYERNYAASVERVLTPFFFVRIPPTKNQTVKTNFNRRRLAFLFQSPRYSPAPWSGVESSTAYSCSWESVSAGSGWSGSPSLQRRPFILYFHPWLGVLGLWHAGFASSDSSTNPTRKPAKTTLRRLLIRDHRHGKPCSARTRHPARPLPPHS
jgi:Kef-type K+ transport system membrane component KefB